MNVLFLILAKFETLYGVMLICLKIRESNSFDSLQ